MDGWALTRLAAVIMIAVAMTAGAVHRAREDISAATRPSPPAIDAPRTDPLRPALERCRELGEVATRDTGCLAAWDENRRRFLTPSEGN